MLITELKAKEAIVSLIKEKAFIINCHGCKEIRFPEQEADELQKELVEAGKVTGIITTDYICNQENMALRLSKHAAAIEAADTILVFSCGVGVQTVAAHFPTKKVCAACDTYALPGFQGVTPLEHDCKQCGQCEVDPSMECGWERIYRKLEKLGKLDVLKCPIQLRDWSTDDAVKK